MALNHVVIGGGIVGVAVATRLALQGSTILIERHKMLGTEVSAHNSEVVHAGIYYPPSSLKTNLCVKGRKMLYDFCEMTNVKYDKCGKWVVAVNPSEMDALQKIELNARASGVSELRMLPKKEIEETAEPHLRAYGVLLSQESGIVDVHSLIQSLAALGRSRELEIAMQHSLIGITRLSNGNYSLDLKTSDGELIQVEAERVINCAGLNSDRVAALALGDKTPKGYELFQSKGFYFAYRGPKLLMCNRLIYPIPEKGVRTLGVHLTIDLNHNVKFGPDKHYMDRSENPDYNFPPKESELIELKQNFLNSIRNYFPDMKPENLQPDYSGIRPTRASPTDSAFKDFIIAEESDKGFPNLVNLVGIESPGVTAALAIGERVAGLLGYKELDRVNL